MKDNQIKNLWLNINYQYNTECTLIFIYRILSTYCIRDVSFPRIRGFPRFWQPPGLFLRSVQIRFKNFEGRGGGSDSYFVEAWVLIIHATSWKIICDSHFLLNINVMSILSVINTSGKCTPVAICRALQLPWGRSIR